MYTLNYGPNVEGKKAQQLYITTEGPLDPLAKKMSAYGFSYVVTREAIVISNSSLGDLLELVGRDKITTEDKKILTRIEKSSVTPLLPMKEEVIFPTFKLPLHKSQREAVYYGIMKERYLLADHMGNGKSFSAISTALYLKAYYDFKYVLVVNGINSNQRNFANEITKLSDAKSIILGSRVLKTGIRKGQTVIRDAKEKIEDLDNLSDETFIITNIQALRNEHIVGRLEKLIASGDIGMVVMDEIHKVIKATSQQGKGLLRLRPRFRMGMSGTPFNNPEDMYTPAMWLGQTYYNNKAYRTNYGRIELDDSNRPQYIFTEHEKFKKDFDSYVLRRTDGLDDLPPISFTDYLLDMPVEQRKLYDSLKHSYITFRGSLEEMSQQAEGQEHIEGRKVINIPHTMGLKSDIKLDTVKELLSEIIANGKTALVYTYFVEAGEHYARELEKTFPGEGKYVTQDKVPYEVVEEFQKGEGSFLVGSVGKVGTGLTITRADYVIFADRPSSWGVYEQAFMRPWRQGRKNPVHVIKLICRDSWDDAISLSQREKKFNADNVLGEIHGDEAVGHKDAIKRNA